MKTKMIVWVLAFAMLSPVQSFAQTNKERTRAEKLEKASNIVGVAVAGGALIGSLFKNKKKKTEQEAMEIAGTDAFVNAEAEIAETAVVGESSQRANTKIITNHPDFKVRIQRCEVSGSTCVIDMIWENVGYQDVQIYHRNSSSDNSVYDDEGNQYATPTIIVGRKNMAWGGTSLLSNVPVKVRIQIEGVSEFATMFRRIDLCIDCNQWILGYASVPPKKFVLMNVPITREGEY